MKRYTLNMVCFLLICSVFSSILFPATSAYGKAKTNIVLDPGHGTDYNYQIFSLDGQTYTEYNLNWRIALYLKDILEQYDEINVSFTKKNEFEHPSLEKRVKIAERIKKKTKRPTYLISLHNNARSDGVSEVTDEGQRGCMVLASNKNYRPQVSDKIDELAYFIVEELEALGLDVNYPEEGGIWRRSAGKTKYPNGKKADYYGLIRHGVLRKIPAIIVEHAYMTDINDTRRFLLSEEGLYSLAVADAKAILYFLELDWDEDLEQFPGDYEE